MNETITPRQARILNIIASSSGIARDAIGTEIEKIYVTSKPTLIRDLNDLIRQKRIKSVGKGPLTRYVSYVDNPLFKKFDIDAYFSVDPDQRNAKKRFDLNVFHHITHIFTQEEMDLLDNTKKSFSMVTSDLDPTILKRELERFVIELSWKSSKIEGNTYTLLETESLIKDKIEAKGRRKDEAIMILNHKAAFDAIVNNAQDFITLTFSNINQLHNVLVNDLNISTGIRKQAVGITGTAYTPLDNQHQIREAVEKMIAVVNKTNNPFEKALMVHCFIPYIQPYTDGNKRTARMLTNAVLLAYDLFPLSYRSVHEEEFKKALILFYEQQSIVSVKKIFIDQFLFANSTYFNAK
ncbi:Fic family protein [Candidatus Gottesmanbacteria bacterium]|nr:Fic family protein [Candidatus Gottesmanbacteria bacterium]